MKIGKDVIGKTRKPSFVVLSDDYVSSHSPEVIDEGERMIIKRHHLERMVVSKNKNDRPVVLWFGHLAFPFGRRWREVWFFGFDTQKGDEIREEFMSFLEEHGTVVYQDKDHRYKVYLVRPEVVQIINLLSKNKKVLMNILDSGLHLKDLTPAELRKLAATMKKII